MRLFRLSPCNQFRGQSCREGVLNASYKLVEEIDHRAHLSQLLTERMLLCAKNGLYVYTLSHRTYTYHD